MTDDWATPGSSAAQPAPAAPVVAGPIDLAPVGAVRPAPRPLPMRPQSVIEILDSGFAIVRARPGLVLGLSAVFIVPLSVFAAWVRRDLLTTTGTDFFDDPSLIQSTTPGDDALAFVIGFLSRSLTQTIVAVSIGLLVAAWYSERDLELGDVLIVLLRRSPAVVAAWLVAHLLQAVAVVGFVVGAFVVAVFTTVVAPVLAIEQVGPVAAVRRSFSLVRGRFWPVLGFFVLSGLLAELLGGILGLLPTLLGFLLTIGGGWVLVVIGTVVAGVVSTSFVAAATVALYLDLRVRREGIDLQLLIPDRFPR